MDEARKKVRVCLLCVVAAAVIIGLVYYFRDVRGSNHVTDGTLVWRTEAPARSVSAHMPESPGQTVICDEKTDQPEIAGESRD